MAAQEFTPTGDSPRVTDDSEGIKGALTAALAAHDKAAETDEVEEKPETEVEQKPEQTGDKTEVKEPAGEKQPVAAKKDAKSAKGEKVDPAPEKTAAEEAAKASEPPAHWSADHKKVFAGLPPEGKTFVLGRMKDMEADYTRKTQAIADRGKEFDGLDQIFGPQRERIKGAGLTVSQVIQGWAGAELALQNGKGLDLIPGLVKAYKIDPMQLATRILTEAGVSDPKAALEQAAAAAAETNKNRPAPVVLPAEVTTKLDRFDRVATHIETQQRAEAEATVTRINSELETFKSATDASGALLHPYFDELINDMGRLAEQATAEKRAVPPIGQLYQEAIFANPAVRQKHLDGMTAAATAKAEAAQRAAAEKATAEAKAKSEKARKAGSSVTGSSGSGQPLNGRKGGDASLRATIAAAADDADQVVH